MMDYFNKDQLIIWKEGCGEDLTRLGSKIGDILESFSLLRKSSVIETDKIKQYKTDVSDKISKIKEMQESNMLFECKTSN